MLSFITVSTLSLLTPFTVALPASTSTQYTTVVSKGNWKGWQNINTWFAMGDSYTMAKNLDEPKLGNGTSSGGPNYVDYLIDTYNKGPIAIHNLAISGSVVDQPYLKSTATNDVWHQIHNDLIPHYTNNNAPSGWDPANTLFSIFIGINDCRADFESNGDATNAHIFNAYWTELKQLYAIGARNFLIINVPPVDLSPEGIARGPDAQKQLAAVIANWNGRIPSIVYPFSRDHPDAAVFGFDSHKLFSGILANPGSNAETVGIKRTTTYCPAYSEPDRPQFVESCEVPLAEYFWFNSLHPSFTVHRALAAEIAKGLQ